MRRVPTAHADVETVGENDVEGIESGDACLSDGSRVSSRTRSAGSGGGRRRWRKRGRSRGKPGPGVFYAGQLPLLVDT